MREFPGFKKGVNLGGWLSQSPLTKEHMDAFITEKDLEAIASIGADHVRLPVDYPLVETEDGTDKEEGYRYIDNCVSWCKKYGLHMLLDLHKAFGYSFGNAANCGSFFENANLQERFLSLWEKFAKRAVERIRSLPVRNCWIFFSGKPFLLQKHEMSLCTAVSTALSIMQILYLPLPGRPIFIMFVKNTVSAGRYGAINA